MDLKTVTNILFLDIETVSQHPTFHQLDERFQRLWEKKAKALKADNPPEESYPERAAIYAEFGQFYTGVLTPVEELVHTV